MHWPIRVIWEGKAHSSYDVGTIERRLAVLKERTDDEAKQEIEFLEKVKRELKA